MDREHVEYAGFWRRAGAALLDYFIFSIVATFLHWVLFGNAGVYVWTDRDGTHFETDQGWFGELLFFAVTIVMWVRLMGTPGKLLLGCHVVDATTMQPIGYKQAVLRYLGYFVSLLPLGLGFVWIALDKRNQGFHDKIAKTLVILESHHAWDDESAKSLEQLVSELR